MIALVAGGDIVVWTLCSMNGWGLNEIIYYGEYELYRSSVGAFIIQYATLLLK